MRLEISAPLFRELGRITRMVYGRGVPKTPNASCGHAARYRGGRQLLPADPELGEDPGGVEEVLAERPVEQSELSF
jgi:hypothetical protein